MEKWLCLGALGVSGFMLILFILDLVTGFPFGKLSPVVDILGAAISADGRTRQTRDQTYPISLTREEWQETLADEWAFLLWQMGEEGFGGR